MKKVLSIIFILSLVFSICACNEENTSSKDISVKKESTSSISDSNLLNSEQGVRFENGNYSQYECNESNCSNIPIYKVYIESGSMNSKSDAPNSCYYYCESHVSAANTMYNRLVLIKKNESKYSKPNNQTEENKSNTSENKSSTSERKTDTHDGEKQCKVCKRYFKMGTDDSWSITKTNMCEQCYKNYKYANELKDEMTK